MKRPQRTWRWLWVALPVVAWFASAPVLNLKLDVLVLIFAGVLALVALRQFRAGLDDGAKDNPNSWLSRDAPTFQNARLLPIRAVTMIVVPDQLANAADLSANVTAAQFGITSGAFCSSGRDCHCGYKSARDRRGAVGVPENTYLDAFGDRRDCVRKGGRETEDFVSSTTIAWPSRYLTMDIYRIALHPETAGVCERGHRKVGDSFRKQQDRCLSRRGRCRHLQSVRPGAVTEVYGCLSRAVRSTCRYEQGRLKCGQSFIGYYALSDVVGRFSNASCFFA